MNRWIAGARPRTLPAAVVPVAFGAVTAIGETGARWWTVPLAAVVSLALQVGVNYANDYSDGVRGTDEVRVGPVRLVASGLAAPGAVKRAAFAAFGVAAAAGAVLAACTSWWLVVLGVACIAAAWGYTGTSRPYGYAGLGEVFVFVFFGLVATVGTAYVVLRRVTAEAVLLGCVAGLMACALLIVNNLRDIPTDAAAGKRTLAVRLGDRRTRRLYVAVVVLAVMLLVPVSLTGESLAFAAVPAGLVYVPPVRAVLGGATGRSLIAVLGGTGRAQLLLGAATCVGVALSLGSS